MSTYDSSRLSVISIGTGDLKFEINILCAKGSLADTELRKANLSAFGDIDMLESFPGVSNSFLGVPPGALT